MLCRVDHRFAALYKLVSVSHMITLCALQLLVVVNARHKNEE